MPGFVPLLRHSARSLRRRPLHAAIAAATVAAGIGASTAAFVLVDAVLLHPLPFQEPDRLVTAEAISPQGFGISLSVPNHHDWTARNRVFETSGSVAGWNVSYTGGERARVLEGRRVLGDLFRTLGLEAVHGRVFGPDETVAGAPAVAVLGWRTFQELGGDPALVGSTLALAGEPHVVVGVLAPGTGYPNDATEVYLPLGTVAGDLPWDDRDSSFGLRLIGRLRPGVSLADAQRDFDRVAAEVRELEGRDVATPSLRSLPDLFVGNFERPLLLLLAAAGLVVCLAVANVANLVLTRAEGRRDELAVRTALGAPRWEAFRLQLGESAWIGALGAGLGMVLAVGMVATVRDWLGAEIPAFVLERLALGGRAAAFALGLAVLVAAVLALVPGFALRSGTPASGALQGLRSLGAPSSQRLRSGLVVGQLALGTLLAVGALLLGSSLERLRSVDKGFDATGVVAARVSLLDDRFGEVEPWRAVQHELVERAGALPGVRSASVSLMLPLSGRSWEQQVTPEGRPYDPDDGDSVLFNIVSRDHFATFGVPLVAGRTFTEGDRDGAEPVVVVDRTLAERYWPGEDPIGRRITFESDPDPETGEERPFYRTVVGVVANVRHYELESPSRIQVYVPLEQTRGRGGFGLHLAVRTDGSTAAAVGALPRLVSEVDPLAVARDVAPVESLIDAALGGRRLVARAAIALGMIALVLAAVGVFAVASHGVAARRRELGLRQALGAAPAALLLGVLGRGVRWAAVGCALGLAGAFAARRVAGSLLWGLGPVEPVPFAGGAAILGAAVLAACLLPALTAMRTDPAEALREEA